MPAKQLKMSLLQVFFEMTTQLETDSGKTLMLLINRYVCLVRSCECNKHSVFKVFMINDLNFQTV